MFSLDLCSQTFSGQREYSRPMSLSSNGRRCHSADIRAIAKRVRLIFYAPPINETTGPKMETRFKETDTYLSGLISPQGNTGFIHIETTEESQEHHRS
jgi:hypothetical protein